ncbi:MAG: glutamate--tRNA ligase [Chloroflexi bacterium]|nr:glutamate--tRNA ligase [Chloroflexota bacterium]
MTKSVRVRFAPSPTGYFHLGSARSALYNWLFARHEGGRFILRIEDTDRTRYDPRALPDLLDSMRWLGLCWDEGPEVGGEYGPYYQSDRVHLYQEYARQLVAEGRAYRCYCSPERLAKLREEQRRAGLTPGYDRHCRYLSAREIADYEAQGIVPVIRLAAPTEGTTEFDDLLRGHIVVNNNQLDDLVLLKSDGFPTYHLANVVDDHLMAITHILRGEEWLSSVPKHVLLYDAFGWEMPVQVHLPNILDPSGKGKLSKRKKKAPGEREMLTYIHEFREAGYLPEAMVNFLALVGWSYDGTREYFTRSELVRLFDLSSVSKSPAAFSYEKLDHMNATYIRNLGYNDLAGRLLQTLFRQGIEADFFTVLKLVPLIRERIQTLNEAAKWVDFVFAAQIDYDTEMLIPRKMDRADALKALRAAREALAEAEPFDEEHIEGRLRALSDALGLKASALLGIIRVATTGKTVAPPLFGTLSILGRETTLARIEAAIARLE